MKPITPQIHHETVETVDVVTLNGSFDMTESLQLDGVLRDLIQGGSYKIALDLTAVSYLVSSAFRAIINAQVRLQLVDGFLRVVCPENGPVYRTFRLSRLDEVVTLCSTREAALTSLR
jgi:anti-anti-sigma factor